MGLKPDLGMGKIRHLPISREGLQLEICPQTRSILQLSSQLIPEFIETSIQEHQRLISIGASAVLKNAPESAVTLVARAGLPTVCVKEFRWRGYVHAVKGLFRPTQGRRTFVNGHLLNSYDVNAAYPLALIRKVTAGVVWTEWVVMQVISHSIPLDRYILQRVSRAWNIEEKRELARSLGRFVAKMHSQGIFHSDLKTCNILVVDNYGDTNFPHDPTSLPVEPPARTARFILVDYDDVTFSVEVVRRRKVKNLVQIFLSTPLVMTMTDRLRFLNEYALHLGMTAKEKRLIAREVILTVQGKTILYVGFQGDITEKVFPN